MNKRVIVAVLAIVAIIGIGAYAFLNYEPLPKDVVLKKYDISTHQLVKEIDVTDKKDLKSLRKYASGLKTLSDREMIDLGILNEVEIRYDDTLTVVMQLGQKDYCSCRGTSEKCSGMSKIPDGLYDWVVSKLS